MENRYERAPSLPYLAKLSVKHISAGLQQNYLLIINSIDYGFLLKDLIFFVCSVTAVESGLINCILLGQA